MSYVIARATGNRAVRSRYIRSVQMRVDGSIMAIGYGTLSEAQSFAQPQSAALLVKRLATHPVFSLDAHSVESMAVPAMAEA